MTENDRLLLNAYIDGELDPAHVLEFEQRLAEDRALADERARIEALRGAMRERLPRATASPELRRRVAALARPFAIDWAPGGGVWARWPHRSRSRLRSAALPPIRPSRETGRSRSF